MYSCVFACMWVTDHKYVHCMFVALRACAVDVAARRGAQEALRAVVALTNLMDDTDGRVHVKNYRTQFLVPLVRGDDRGRDTTLRTVGAMALGGGVAVVADIDVAPDAGPRSVAMARGNRTALRRALRSMAAWGGRCMPSSARPSAMTHDRLGLRRDVFQADAVVAPSFREGLRILLQVAGLGDIRPNIVALPMWAEPDAHTREQLASDVLLADFGLVIVAEVPPRLTAVMPAPPTVRGGGRSRR